MALRRITVPSSEYFDGLCRVLKNPAQAIPFSIVKVISP